MPLQVLQVAGQVGEQRPHLPAPLGLQEEALVVAGAGAGRGHCLGPRPGWRGSHRLPDPSCPCVALSPQDQALALTLSSALAILFLSPNATLHPGTPLPPAPPLLPAHDRKKLALLLEVLRNCR